MSSLFYLYMYMALVIAVAIYTYQYSKTLPQYRVYPTLYRLIGSLIIGVLGPVIYPFYLLVIIMRSFREGWNKGMHS